MVSLDLLLVRKHCVSFPNSSSALILSFADTSTCVFVSAPLPIPMSTCSFSWPSAMRVKCSKTSSACMILFLSICANLSSIRARTCGFCMFSAAIVEADFLL
ncbi:unnamed protein product [Bacillus phage SPP1]|uniref:Bacteriophage SPP1 complete nucleotide sequence n=1 Tax=Bacillus phage SPP1 TaxID=10724 RepID=O48435_BPSPP|nr:hypothetical protein SPP1p002 [Bacillus phage SPP1]CAA66572.1 unnamed protein product [Bacillus phage SPP1]